MRALYRSEISPATTHFWFSCFVMYVSLSSTSLIVRLPVVTVDRVLRTASSVSAKSPTVLCKRNIHVVFMAEKVRVGNSTSQPFSSHPVSAIAATLLHQGGFCRVLSLERRPLPMRVPSNCTKIAHGRSERIHGKDLMNIGKNETGYVKRCNARSEEATS